VIATALVEDKLFTGFPTFKFVLSGIPLYDPSKDSTNGGSGPQRYSDPATWGGDGDQLPAVQAYNVLRGIRYAGAWLYGLQNIAGAARLPAANWNAQIAKCRATVIGLSGAEPSYRSGGQVNVNSQPANLLETLLTACQGRISETGGFYKIHLGAPDSPTFSWADADLLSSEQQIYRPFFSLADSINGIQGSYPDPAQGWETATAPALYRSDLEVRDGNRRLMANPAFDFCPYPEQVQRLQKSGLEEAQRARTHVLPMPPAYWVIEPGDVGTWNSFRNGYIDKLFRVDSVIDRPNLDCVFNVTEIDPSDYDWTHGTDYTGITVGPTVIPRPHAQGVIDWFAEGAVLYDADGLGRRPAIRIAWDGSLPGVVGVQYEVRLTFDLSHVTRGRTDQLTAGALIISQGLIENTAYQVRGQYLPSSPREMLWSDWLDVTTPDIPAADIPAWIGVQVTSVMDYLNDRLTEVEQRIATYTSRDMARNWTDQKETRSQMSSRTEAAFAEISHVETVATSADAAMASDIETLTAEVGSVSTTVDIHATAIASIEGWGAANYGVTLDVNGYSTGFELLNGGGGISSATFVQDKFQIAAPGVGGGAPVPIFTVANVAGSPKIAIRGDMYADGTIAASRIIAGSITSTQIAADTITAGNIQAGAINTSELAINSVDIVNIIDGSASNTTAATGTAPGTAGGGTVCSLTIATKAGRAIAWAVVYPFANGDTVATLILDGGTVRTVTTYGTLGAYDSGTGTYAKGPSAPVVIMHYATGLSDANHTFTLTTDNPASPGTLIANNPRR
jgi:hypothetical protein